MTTKPRPPARAARLRTIGAEPDHHPKVSDLYRRAEARLRKQRRPQRSRAAVPGAEADPRRLLHELQVHQVELELQNTELREARDRMEILLEKYTDLYDFAPVGYFTLAPDGAIEQVNLTGAQMVGIERSRLVGQRFGLLIRGERRAAFQDFLTRVFAGQATKSCDVELVRPGQPLRIVNLEAQRLRNGQACRAAVVDITERKQAEEAVRVSEIRYRRLFEAAHDGVLLVDPETRKITDANPFMTRLLGYTRDALVGKELFEIGLLKDEAVSQEMFRRLQRKHEVRYEDLPLESQAGRHQEVEVVANLYQENGHSVIQCNIRDITERKQAEEMLRRNEALFSALVAQAPVGVYVVDARMRLQQLNPKARHVFSRVHPLIGRDFSEIIHALWPRRVADQVVERFRHTLKTGAPYQVLDFAERRRDIGVKEHYEWQIQRVTLPAGEHGVVCFFSNITARKRAEAAQRRLDLMTASNRRLNLEIIRRRAMEKSLRESERHQSELLKQARRMQEQLRQLSRQVLQAQEDERKRISRELHDVIAQTLTGISVRLGTLKKAATLDAGGLDRSITSTQRLVRKSVEIVHQFARELRPAVLDDLGLIPALHSFMKQFTARTGVRTRLTAFAAVEQLSITQRTVLYRVAQEALTNVGRHARASRADVSILKLPDRICMKIADDGKSFQVHRVLRSQGSKHLGLLGMQERLEMVGGRFGIESSPGKGTTIEAQIPLGKTRLAEGAPLEVTETKC